MSDISSLTNHFDPRLVLQVLQAFWGDSNNGILILSTRGIHFYRSRRGEHTILADTSVKSGYAITADYVAAQMLKPLGKGAIRMYRPGFGKASGGGPLGHLVAGTINTIGRASSANARATFMETFQQAQQQVPAIDGRKNLHLAHFEYYLAASLLGPAIDTATMVIECALLQKQLANNPGMFGMMKLRASGHNDREPLTMLTPEQITTTRRMRAWLRIEGRRYQDLIDENKSGGGLDAEVDIAYAIAHFLKGKKTDAIASLEHAGKQTPHNSKVQAATAWKYALQGRKTDAERISSNISTQADQYALLLAGMTKEALGQYEQALNHYAASFSYSHGYIEGTFVCERVLELAPKVSTTYAYEVIRRLTQLNPEQRTAWQGLASIATKVGDTSTARNAQEHIAAMAGFALNLR